MMRVAVHDDIADRDIEPRARLRLGGPDPRIGVRPESLRRFACLGGVS